jgi:hypothetical protein
LWRYDVFHRWLGAYERYLAAERHQVDQENTQKIASKHSNLRTRITRLVRRTLCFSKTERMHDLMIGLFINRYEFRQSLGAGINTCETSSFPAPGPCPARTGA